MSRGELCRLSPVAMYPRDEPPPGFVPTVRELPPLWRILRAVLPPRRTARLLLDGPARHSSARQKWCWRRLPSARDARARLELSQTTKPALGVHALLIAQVKVAVRQTIPDTSRSVGCSLGALLSSSRPTKSPRTRPI